MKIKRILIALLFLLSLSCGLLSRAPGGVAPLIPLTGQNAAGGTAVPPYIPAQCTGQPVATLPAATTEALPTPSAGTNPSLSKTDQELVFAQLTSLIPTRYVYPDLNGLDWEATKAKYRAEIDAGLDTEAFYAEMQKLINELKDDHSQYESPAQVAASNAELAGHNDYVGIGVEIVPFPDKNLLSVLVAFPGSAAEHAGLKPHDNLLSVDGIPLIKNGEQISQIFHGPACTAVVVTVQTPGTKPRNITMLRYAINSYTPIVARKVTTQDGSRIGYIYLPSFFDETIPTQVKQALEQFGPLDGLILDNRMNPGGSSDVVEPILADFTDGVLGHFVSRIDSTPVEVKASPVGNSQTVPLVVLVGPDTASFGEIFSGILQDIGRAKVVGQTTPGNVEILASHTFIDGSRLWLAERRFEELHSKADWEKTGIVPDVTAYADWNTFTFENDPSVAAAVKLLGHK
jgi:carboxyl-terminal processing protease